MGNASSVITLTPKVQVVRFRRTRVRLQGWYEEAATRYVAHLAKKHLWIWRAPTVKVEREPAERCYYVYVRWEASDAPELLRQAEMRTGWKQEHAASCAGVRPSALKCCGPGEEHVVKEGRMTPFGPLCDTCLGAYLTDLPN